MVGLLIQMHITTLRRQIDGSWIFWLCVSGLLAVGTLLLAAAPGLEGRVLPDLLALTFCAWMLLVALVPIFGGGSAVRAEHMALLPLSLRQIAIGLLGVAAVGIVPIAALMAFAALPLYGFQLGIVPGIVGVLMLVLQFALVLLLGRVIYGVMGQAMQTQLGMELVGFQFGLLFAGLSVGWFTVEPAIRQTERLLAEGLTPVVSNLLLALPSGWGVVGIEAASRGDWLRLTMVIGAFALTIGALLWLWSVLVSQSLSGRAVSGVGRRSKADSGASVVVRQQSPLGAIIFKEMRAWQRDPWRALEYRTGFWTGILTALIPLLVGSTGFMPFAGIIMVLFGGMGTSNLYAMDGSALWQTLLTPGAERLDVRGRQWAWLWRFAPLSVGLTVIFTLVSGQHWAWPLVLGMLAASLGGLAGLTVFFSVVMASPAIDPQHRRNPMDATGSDVNAIFSVLGLMIVIMAPAVLVTVYGFELGSVAVQWAGVLVGVMTGVGLAWVLGRFAYRYLESNGPELLNRLLRGKSQKPSTEEQDILNEMPKNTRLLVQVCQSLFWLPLLPQGLVPLGSKLIGSEEKSWFLALYLPEPLQWPVIFAMIALGAWMLYIAFEVPRKYKRERERAKSQPIDPA